MFGISFDELLIVILVAVLFVRPQDVPTFAKGYKSSVKSIRKMKKSAEDFFVDFHNRTLNFTESDANDDDVSSASYIMDEQGNIHKSYDISEYKNKTN